jgi:predicted ATP-dependent endonuclease of OLD family
VADEQQKVVLQEINISGYRSCQGTVFQPHSNLTALIGINGVGKTNILNAIHLLAPQDGRRFPIGAPEEKSGPETVITAWFIVGEVRIGLRLTLILGSGNRGEGEILSHEEEWHFGTLTNSKKWTYFPAFTVVDNPTSPSAMYERRWFLHSNRAGSTRSIAAQELNTLIENAPLVDAVRKIAKFRQSIKYYSASQFTDPTRCPSNFEVDSDKHLETNFRTASNHLKFLFDLYSLRNTNLALYEEYVAFVSRNQLGLISRLSWKEIKLSSYTAVVKSKGTVQKVKRYKILVIPRIQIGSSHITFNQLSEGTFKTLALIFYIMTDASACLLIEEPEVCVHHGLLTRIISTISAYAREKQIIFSTHSDLVLDNIEQENVFVVNMQKAITHVSSLSKWAGAKGRSALNAYLQESGTLGEYWRSGGFAS